MKTLTMLLSGYLIALAAADLPAATSIENAALTPIGLAGNDIVFDSTRNVLYLSVPSAAGYPYGNSIVTIDPATAQIIHSTYVGSEPDALAISSDGSRVYVGIDGAYSFCWWEPATDTVSALVPFSTTFAFGPSIANGFAIDPADPHTIIASKADVSSTADGDLEVFHDNSSILDMNLIYGAESICFGDPTNLIGFNNEDTGFDLWKWAFDGTHLTQTKDVGSVISGFYARIKSVDGLIFSDNGKVVAASSLSALGTFSPTPASAAVEPMPGTNVVYFLGYSGISLAENLQLVSFDRNTFLKIDSKSFTNAASSSMRSLVQAGKEPSGGDRLGFIQFDGTAGIISIPPPVFKIERFLTDGSTSQLTWASEVGLQYQVQWSADMHNWTTFITTNATQFHTTNTFHSMGGIGREFYRVVAN